MDEDNIVGSIIESCSKYIYSKIHGNLAIAARQVQVNKIEYYEQLIIGFATAFETDRIAEVEIANMYKFHKDTQKNTILPPEEFIVLLANRYTFHEHSESERFGEKTKKIREIFRNVIIDYARYLKTKDVDLLLSTDINRELKEVLKHKISSLIRKYGVIIQYRALSGTQTVSMELFNRLVKLAKKRGVELI